MISQSPLCQLILSNLRTYLREPEAIFWTYGFPILMIIGLGLAFSGKGDDSIVFDVVKAPGWETVIGATEGHQRFQVEAHLKTESLDRLRRNKTSLVVEIGPGNGFIYYFDPTNPQGRLAREAVDDLLQRAAGRVDPKAVEDLETTAPGSRYVDFLVPGLIGMNLMGGGLWGVGFVLVDLRVKNLLKRLLGTPMRRGHFLLAMVGGRALFFVPEVFLLLLAAWLIFKIPIQGSVAAIFLVAFIGAMSFAGLGLLVASRARRIETVSGLMNLVMMPMWLCSGIFFSSERFPDFMQPFIKALPLTQLINALRAVITDGETLVSQALPVAIMLVWGSVSYALALRWFRWN